MDQICLDPQDKLPLHPPHPSDTLSTKHPPPTGQKSEDNFWNSPNLANDMQRPKVILSALSDVESAIDAMESVL